MKNGCDEILEAKIAEQNERARKLYRYVSDVARRVSEATVACRSMADLFTTMLEVQRQKLRDNCEKLLFLDPVNHGKKSLELLWRKVYYDTISTAKKLRETDQDYDTYLFTLIVGGIGHFHNFITRIQTDMKLQLKELDYNPINGDDKQVHEPSEEELEFGRSALHTCLIYLGDLSRYQAEIFHAFDPSIAARYYLQAAHIDMASGMPYNQLGNLYLDRNYNLDSVCYYIHCLSCASPFDGAMGNLNKIFEKSIQYCEALNDADTLTQSEHLQTAVANFLSLIEIWYLNKTDSSIPQRCNVIAQEFKVAMDFTVNPLPDVNKNYEEYNQALEEESINPSFLNGNLIHKIVQICLFTMAKMNEIDEKKAFACKAFTLALLSQLLQKLLKQLEALGLKNPARKYKPRKPSIQEPQPDPEPVKELTKGKTTPEEEIIQNGKEEHDDLNDENLKENPISDEDKKKLPNGDAKSAAKKALAKRRRRRRVASSDSSDISDAETETSDVETDESCSDEDLSDSSFPSEDDSHSDGSFNECSDNEEPKKEINGTHTPVEEKNNKVSENNDINNHEDTPEKPDIEKEAELNEEEIKKFLQGDNILPSIKLLQDWILTEKDLILSCGESGESLFQCVVDLLNIFTYYFNAKNNEIKECNILLYVKKLVKKLRLEYKTIPLPEDVNLRGTNICKFDKKASEWQILDKYKPTVYEENVIRILNFIEFGNQIAKIVPRIRFNRSMKIFYLKKIPHAKSNTKVNHHKRTREWHNSKKPHPEGAEGGLLRRLGKLWLQSRVRELERGDTGAPPPALLALDAAALHVHLRRVKQLLHARSFVLLVPAVVLQELDDLKRTRSSARDAIRWLELQLKSGSRYLRAQRPGQAKPLPLPLPAGTPPRKPAPALHNKIQILEFCNHFIADEKQSQGGNGDPDSSLHGKAAPMLVLLVGEEIKDEDSKEFSVARAAAAAGIAVQYICDFYSAWRARGGGGGRGAGGGHKPGNKR
ncbi:hypothetical protein O0L34_g15380 [Tuta absoluta]|nr:hypothetical protein O0L34_g15380 [Tuta absoluta]